VAVGIHTVLNDNPGLCGIRRDPYKIIFDPELKIPLGARVLKSKQPGVIVVTRRRALAQKKKKSILLKKKAILVDAPMQGRYFDLKKLLKVFYRQGIMSVFVEGGAFTVGAFFDQRCVDKIYFFLAPKIVGGAQALSSVGGAGVSTLREAYCVENVEIEKIGLDFLITGYPVKK
jgi:diaminohydroxyphosphoribosylaminopyrimidine deaminase/5-amino-6-(5-phosphoribosylamino)uracil reductase